MWSPRNRRDARQSSGSSVLVPDMVGSLSKMQSTLVGQAGLSSMVSIQKQAHELIENPIDAQNKTSFRAISQIKVVSSYEEQKDIEILKNVDYLSIRGYQTLDFDAIIGEDNLVPDDVFHNKHSVLGMKD